MTQKEMTEIFSLLLLAYPNAEMFKGGVGKLKPTIELWTAALPDVDFQMGKQAVIRFIRASRFPPTIAEFRESVSGVMAEIEGRSMVAWNTLKAMITIMGRSPAEAVADENTPEFVRQVVRYMGGPDKLIRRFPDGTQAYAYYDFLDAYKYVALKQAGNPLDAKEERKQIGGSR